MALSATRKALGLFMGNFAIQGKGLRSKSSQCSILNSFHPKCGSQSPHSQSLEEPYSCNVNRDVNATPLSLVQKLPISYWVRTIDGIEYLGDSELSGGGVRLRRGGEKLHPGKSIIEEMLKNSTCIIIDRRPYDLSAEPPRKIPCLAPPS